jgi:predicted permease
MSSPVLTSLLPVVVLVLTGYTAGRLRWVRTDAIKDLSNLVFLVLSPALLFRTMGQVNTDQLQWGPPLAYFLATLLLYAGMLGVLGFNRRAAVLALAATYSNMLMIGIPFVTLSYGPDGLVVLLTLVSLHSLILLTASTLVIELAVAHEAAQGLKPGGVSSHDQKLRWRSTLSTLATATRNALLHPVPLPIVLGLLYSLTGWGIPEVIDKPMQWLGSAFAPLALVLLGITLATANLGDHWRQALAIAGVKNMLLPLVVAGVAVLMGLQGLPLLVLVVTAGLPIGANVFLFSQRYEVAQGLATSSVTVSNLLALITLPVVMAAAAWLAF